MKLAPPRVNNEIYANYIVPRTTPDVIREEMEQRHMFSSAQREQFVNTYVRLLLEEIDQFLERQRSDGGWTPSEPISARALYLPEISAQIDHSIQKLFPGRGVSTGGISNCTVC